MSTEENIANLRRALEAWNTPSRRSEYFEIYAPGASIHAHGATTVDGLRPFYDAIWAAFPDAKANIEEIVAEGDKLAYRVSVRATHTGKFGDLPATGKKITISKMGIAQFADGKIVRREGHDNAHEVMQQLQQ